MMMLLVVSGAMLAMHFAASASGALPPGEGVYRDLKFGLEADAPEPAAVAVVVPPEVLQAVGSVLSLAVRLRAASPRAIGFEVPGLPLLPADHAVAERELAAQFARSELSGPLKNTHRYLEQKLGSTAKGMETEERLLRELVSAVERFQQVAQGVPLSPQALWGTLDDEEGVIHVATSEGAGLGRATRLAAPFSRRDYETMRRIRPRNGKPSLSLSMSEVSDAGPIYASGFVDVPLLSWAEAIEPGAQLRGRMVIVGRADDLVHGPGVSRPLAAVQAAVLNDLLQGRALRRSAPTVWAELVLIALMPLVVLLIVRRFPGSTGPRVLWLLAAFILGADAILFFGFRELAYPLLPLAAEALSVILLFGVRERAKIEEQIALEDSMSRFVGEAVGRRVAEKVGTGETSVPELDLQSGAATVVWGQLLNLELLESLPPTRLRRLLLPYFGEVRSAVFEYGGAIEHLSADAFAAAFLGDQDEERASRRAVLSALQLVERIEGLGLSFQAESLPKLRVQVVLSAGPVVAGPVGHGAASSWAVVGTPLRLARELADFAPRLGGRVVLGQEVREAFGDRGLFRRLGRVWVDTSRAPTWLHECFAFVDPSARDRRFVETWEQALDTFLARNFGAAEAVFRESEAYTSPEDPGPRAYQKLCRDYLEVPPPEDWDGTWISRGLRRK